LANFNKLRDMIALPIISFICCIAYIIFIVFKYGVPVSLSETFYLLPEKIDWLFSAWCTMVAVPLGIYWFMLAPGYLCWIPLLVMFGLLFTGVSCRYKGGCKCEGCNEVEDIEEVILLPFWQKIKSMLKAFNPKNGSAKFIHFVCSIMAIILSTVYICIMNKYGWLSVIFFYPLMIAIGLNIPGVYNKNTALDTNDSAWIFFMEVVCFCLLFIFIW